MILEKVWVNKVRQQPCALKNLESEIGSKGRDGHDRILRNMHRVALSKLAGVPCPVALFKLPSVPCQYMCNNMLHTQLAHYSADKRPSFFGNILRNLKEEYSKNTEMQECGHIECPFPP